MHSLAALFSNNGTFLGVDWNVWKVIGWTGNTVFFLRFVVQWHATEKRKRVVVPAAFWWLSLVGSLLLLVYSIERNDKVFIVAYLFNWIPYSRNLIIHHRYHDAHRDCPNCGVSCTPQSNFCPDCGTRLGVPAEQAGGVTK